MKKKFSFVLLSLFLVMGTANVSAQKWLDKALNTLNKVDKALSGDVSVLSESMEHSVEVLQPSAVPIVTDPSALEGQVLYKLEDPGYMDLKYGQTYFTQQWSTNVTYTNENGDLVRENNVKLPWSKIITVKAPFKAILQYEHKIRRSTLPKEEGPYYSVVRYIPSTRYTNASFATFQVGVEGYVQHVTRGIIGTSAMYQKGIDSWLMQYGNRRYEYNFTEENFSKDTGWRPKPKEPEMTITVSDTKSCSGGTLILKIRGGVPFKSGEPFKIATKHIDGDNGTIYLEKFQNRNGEYIVEIGTGVDGFESHQQLIIDDSEGNKKETNFTIYNCP
jgi:hypothetical protein